MNSRIRCGLILLALTAAVASARADLFLTNYSASHLLKIMPIGDSITDDCSLNGAWRLYLQPLLENNGYPFNFVGRQSSSTALSFTKVKHEGYCGAVIAPPGVFTVHGYETTNAYLLKIVADALAVTANTPDLVLLLIGANDIGRGRDPYQVATNDMANLLNLIQSNAPNSYIIIAKITSLQDANLPGLTYGAYATNVPIYNAALQSMVNQRHALGQNVFLADMYSVVDYNTMFMSDHVHPNSSGLIAMAREWLARIQAITQRTNIFASTFIHGGDKWKYSDSGQDLGTNWAQPEFDDSNWNTGFGRFGYGDPATASTVSFGPDVNNKFVTTYFRRTFVMPWDYAITNLNFRLARAHGAAVWLNGLELFRTNLSSGPLSYTNLAVNVVGPFNAHVYYPTNIPVTAPLSGTNLIAVELHQSSATNTTLGFDIELLGSGNLISPPSLSIAQGGTNIILSWPLTNSDTFALYSSTNVGAPVAWSQILDSAQTNGSQIVVTQIVGAAPKFYRLQRH